MWRKLVLLVCAAVQLTQTSITWAAPITQIVDSSSLISTRINYHDGSRSKSKLIYCLLKTPGTAKGVSGGVLFTPIALTIAKLKARGIAGSRLNTQVSIKKAGSKACVGLADGLPAPTPTPFTGIEGNFDASGNLTAKGKVTFGVPASIDGNISVGRVLSATNCACHSEMNGRSFSYLRATIAGAPMYFDATQIPDSMLANLTAYLNRFRP